MTIIVRPPDTLPEIEIIEWLQEKIWGDLGITPMHVLLTLSQEAGSVLIAFDGKNPVGFAYGFPAFTAAGQLKFASHQVGVLPDYQDRGVGYQLKLAQREAALSQNFSLMTWTYDPLQSRNARLNLGKLGAVCRTYIPNHYGEMTDELNKGLPSDRFRVDWWLASPHVVQRLTGRQPAKNGPVLNPATFDDRGLVLPPANYDPPNGQTCLVEIPADITILKQQAPQAARQWRFQTRAIFETAFTGGYSATDLLRQDGRSYYVLERDWQPGVEEKN